MSAQLTVAAGKRTAFLLVRLLFTAVHLKWACNAVWRSWTTHSPTLLHEYFIVSLSSGLRTSPPSSSQTETLLPTVWRKSYPRKSTSSGSPLHLASHTASVSMSLNLSPVPTDGLLVQRSNHLRSFAPIPLLASPRYLPILLYCLLQNFAQKLSFQRDLVHQCNSNCSPHCCTSEPLNATVFFPIALTDI